MGAYCYCLWLLLLLLLLAKIRPLLMDTSFHYNFLAKQKPPTLGIRRHINFVLQCHEMIRAYRTGIVAEDPRTHLILPRANKKSYLNRPDTVPVVRSYRLP